MVKGPMFLRKERAWLPSVLTVDSLLLERLHAYMQFIPMGGGETILDAQTIHNNYLFKNYF